MSVVQYQEDVAELKAFIKQSKRPNVRKILESELKRVEELITKQKPAAPAPSAAPEVSVQKSATSSKILPEIKITNYGWDESEKFVKLYITLNNFHLLPAESIKSEFSDSSFQFHVSNLEGKNYWMAVKELRSKIVPKESLIKQKTNSLLLMLKKAEPATWGSLTRAEHQEKEKSTPNFDEKADPQEALMNMMKKMYDEGDDETKRGIRKAWHEGQNKKTGGLGGMEGF